MLFSTLLILVRDAIICLGYISGKTSFPKPLDAKTEKEYIMRMAQGDEYAKNKLIEHNLRLVAHITKKYINSGQDIEDLISIGSIGLIKAVNTYKHETGTQLATYAARCIENEIRMTLRAARKRRNDISLQEPIGTDPEGNEISFIDILGTDNDFVPDEVIKNISIKRLRVLMGILDQRERLIITLRFGLDGCPPRPQRIIAEQLGISRSYVSRIEKRAIMRLCDALMPDD